LAVLEKKPSYPLLARSKPEHFWLGLRQYICSNILGGGARLAGFRGLRA
jgi:hypothetical protein